MDLIDLRLSVCLEPIVQPVVLSGYHVRFSSFPVLLSIIRVSSACEFPCLKRYSDFPHVLTVMGPGMSTSSVKTRLSNFTVYEKEKRLEATMQSVRSPWHTFSPRKKINLHRLISTNQKPVPCHHQTRVEQLRPQEGWQYKYNSLAFKGNNLTFMITQQ